MMKIPRCLHNYNPFRPVSVVEILDTFWYGKHFCIVEELYDTTLLGSLVMPSMPGSDALPKFKPNESNFFHVERPLCQPRFVSNKSSDIKSKILSINFEF
jgi:hypothetical protein